jgi:hypothetical protein
MRTLAAALLVLFAQEDSAKIEKLCGDLGSSDPEVREKAVKELAATGKPALPALRRLAAGSDAEVKGRAEAAIKRIHDALRSKALRLEVACDRKEYKPGDRVTIRASLKNVEEFAVVALRFRYDGGPHPDSWIRVALDGRNVRYAGDPLKQVRVHHRMTEDRFLTVKAGESAVVRSVDFAEAWDLAGRDPGLKDSYRDAKTAPLKPGTYKVKATYAWRFDVSKLDALEKEPESHPQLKWSFEGSSKELLRDAWQGSLEAEAEFVVRE